MATVDWVLLRGLTPSQQHEVHAGLIWRQYSARDTLVREGDPSTSVYLMASGHVAVRVSARGGPALTLAVVGPGGSFGEVSATSPRGFRTTEVVALDAVRVGVVPGRVFDRLRRSSPALNSTLAEILALRVQELIVRFEQTLQESVPRRTARCLLELADCFTVSPGRPTPAAEASEPEAPEPEAPVVIPLTQDDLAGLVGATRASVNQALQSLYSTGYVRSGRGRIEVTNVRGLRRYTR
jgi:CRP/FNR family cyclic AMP-dependent transcriptional regulator